MWLLNNHIPKAFEIGFNAAINSNNPFNPYTNEWYSWNRGYNLNDKKWKN